MANNKIIALPDRIKILVRKIDDEYLVDLPELGVFTECAHPIEIFFNVNDLIYTYFDIPKGLQKKFFYAPKPPASGQRHCEPPEKHPYSLVKVISQKNENFRVKGA